LKLRLRRFRTLNAQNAELLIPGDRIPARVAARIFTSFAITAALAIRGQVRVARLVLDGCIDLRGAAFRKRYFPIGASFGYLTS